LGLGDKVRDTLTAAAREAYSLIQDQVAAAGYQAASLLLKRLERDLATIEAPLLDEALANPALPDHLKVILRAARNPAADGAALLSAAGGMAGMIFALFDLIHIEGERGRQAWWALLPHKLPDTMSSIRAAWRTDRDLFGPGAAEYQPPFILTDVLAAEGYGTEARAALINAIRPLLEPNELRQLLLRGRIDGNEFDRRMYRLGYTARDVPLFKSLHEVIPNIPDLIRMAVREAFTPEIAEKFGQYANLPEAAAAEAAKLGLTHTWFERYWAAHWDLPSINQGFEMFQRTVERSTDPVADALNLGQGKSVQNVIGRRTLDLLLRAQDVMPFWRDKLPAIAYHPLTRVDVRRMFALGVLDRPGVKRAYLDLGYNDANAELMTQFTEKYQTASDRELTKGDIVGSLRAGVIERAEAEDLLELLEYGEDEIAFLLDAEDAKKASQGRDLTVGQYKLLYYQSTPPHTDISAALAELGFDAKEIAALFSLWELARPARDRRPSLADIKTFRKKGIISPEEWAVEMAGLGFADRYIAMYEQSGFAAGAEEEQ